MLIYEVEERAQLFQLSLNIPTYTKSAKIYQTLLDIMKISENQQSKFQKEPKSKDIEIKLKKLE